MFDRPLSPFSPYRYGFTDDEAGWVCCGGPVLLLVLVGVLATAARCLGRVDPANRRMGPGGVWLNLVPVLNLVWLPVTVERVGESLRAELVERGRDRKADGYGKPTGLTALVLFWVPLFVPPAVAITGPFGLIYLVAYWIILARYGRRLRDEAPRYSPPADEGW